MNKQINKITMKKLLLTIAILLGMGMGTYAQDYMGEIEYEERGLFGLGKHVGADRNTDESLLGLPYEHGLNDDQDANGPLGSGIAVLAGLGAAYFVGKKRREE